MAGKRRGTGKPMRRTIRPAARIERLNQALATTDDPRTRVGIAVDHYRSAQAAHPDSADAERVVQYLVDAGTRLYNQKGGARVHDGQ